MGRSSKYPKQLFNNPSYRSSPSNYGTLFTMVYVCLLLTMVNTTYLLPKCYCQPCFFSRISAKTSSTSVTYIFRTTKAWDLGFPTSKKIALVATLQKIQINKIFQPQQESKYLYRRTVQVRMPNPFPHNVPLKDRMPQVFFQLECLTYGGITQLNST